MKIRKNKTTYQISDHKPEYGLVKLNNDFWAFNTEVKVVLEPDDIKPGINTEEYCGGVRIKTGTPIMLVIDIYDGKTEASDEWANDYDVEVSPEAVAFLIENSKNL